MNIAKNLCCPLCGQAFVCAEAPLKCPNNHSFDVARQGYVNLLPVQQKKSREPGDSKEMIVARQQFLDSGIYQPIAALMANMVESQTAHLDSLRLLDAGCGEGYYLDYLAQHLTREKIDWIGLDISKPAIVAAAKRNKTMTWIVGSNRQLPVLPQTLDMIVCMFGFPVYESFKAALKPGGKVVLLDAAENHLIELRDVIYPDVRKRPPPSLERAEQLGFELVASDRLTQHAGVIDRQQLNNLLVMTPHLYRAPREGKEAIAQLDELSITIDVSARVLQLGSEGDK